MKESLNRSDRNAKRLNVIRTLEHETNNTDIGEAIQLIMWRSEHDLTTTALCDAIKLHNAAIDLDALNAIQSNQTEFYTKVWLSWDEALATLTALYKSMEAPICA